MKPSLTELYENHDGNLVLKPEHFTPIYDRLFAPYRDRPVNILEIGVFQGGSLDIWEKFFHPDSKIFGLDITPDVTKFARDNIEIFIGDQGDKAFMEDLAAKLPPLDIVLDDGGHTMEQQKVTFDVLYPKVVSDGIYVCEDIFTSYDPHYGGGFNNPSTFVEYAKGKIDDLIAWDENTNRMGTNGFVQETYSIEFFSGTVAFKKAPLLKNEPQMIIKSGQMKEPAFENLGDFLERGKQQS